MSRLVSSDKIFHLLASNAAMYDEVMNCVRIHLQEETDKLHQLAVAALLNPDKVPVAQAQYGRVDCVRTLLSLAEKFKRSE